MFSNPLIKPLERELPLNTLKGNSDHETDTVKEFSSVPGVCLFFLANKNE